MLSRSKLRFSAVLAQAENMGFTPTTEHEIDLAVAAGISRSSRTFYQTNFSYAARFWAALRRLYSDCSQNVENLAEYSGIHVATLYHYKGTPARSQRTLFAADQLDIAAMTLMKN